MAERLVIVLAMVRDTMARGVDAMGTAANLKGNRSNMQVRSDFRRQQMAHS